MRERETFTLADFCRDSFTVQNLGGKWPHAWPSSRPPVSAVSDQCMCPRATLNLTALSPSQTTHGVCCPSPGPRRCTQHCGRQCLIRQPQPHLTPWRRQSLCRGHGTWPPPWLWQKWRAPRVYTVSLTKGHMQNTGGWREARDSLEGMHFSWLESVSGGAGTGA